MFGKKKANKTIDRNTGSSDTSSQPVSGTNDTTSPMTELKVSSGPSETAASSSDNRSEPRLFQPRMKEESQMSSKPHSTSFRPEIPKRPLEIPTRGTGGRPSSSSHNTEGKRLTVGRDIRLAGEIGSCDILVVEGHVEAQISECQRLEVAEGGTFAGTAKVDDAEISGRFDGELNASRVTILRTAEISGKIQYGSINVENGARIKGELDYVEGSDTGLHDKAPSAAITIPRKSDDN
jgi:cytoskeletal protein CcmA (bactofilin family)